MTYSQARIALGLTEDQAAAALVVAAYGKGLLDASNTIIESLDSTSVAEAVARRLPLRPPNAVDLLLADAPMEDANA